MNGRSILFVAGGFAALILVGAGGVMLGRAMPLAPERPPDSSATPSAYASLLDDEIRGMDAATIEGYRTGQGLGMALPAELNGYPGPRHVLEMSEELNLTEAQRAEIQALFDQMQAQAIPLGQEILIAEADVERAFREKTIDEAGLSARLDEIAVLEAQLRYVHLSTHLATIDVLDEFQVQHYNVVRGYADPAQFHEGHDPAQHPS